MSYFLSWTQILIQRFIAMSHHRCHELSSPPKLLHQKRHQCKSFNRRLHLTTRVSGKFYFQLRNMCVHICVLCICKNLSSNGSCLHSTCCSFSTGSKFQQVSSFTELHTLTLSAHSYAVLCHIRTCMYDPMQPL